MKNKRAVPLALRAGNGRTHTPFRLSSCLYCMKIIGKLQAVGVDS